MSKIHLPLIFLSFLLLTKTCPAQETACTLYKMVMLDDSGRVNSLKTSQLIISLENEKPLSLILRDYSLSFTTLNKLIISPPDALHYSLFIKDQSLILLKDGDSINLSAQYIPASFKNKLYSNSWKQGIKSTLDVQYDSGRLSNFKISDLNRSCKVFMAYYNRQPEVAALKIEWFDSGNLLDLIFMEGYRPYWINYYEKKLNSGISLRYKFKQRWLSDFLMYEFAKDKISEKVPSSLNAPDWIGRDIINSVLIRYDRNGKIAKEFLENIPCK